VACAEKPDIRFSWNFQVMFEWLVFAFIFDAVWLVLYVSKPHLRHQMLWVSVLTALTGLLEPIFVPRYWTPPSLFNLAATTHFDVESLVFSFGTEASVQSSTKLPSKCGTEK
jgi:hypothetical protein